MARKTDPDISTIDHKTSGGARWTAYHAKHRGMVGYGETEDDAIKDLQSKVRPRESARKNLFIGTYSTGLSYADKSREKNGDYLKVAFLPFSTLKLEWSKGVTVSKDMRALIELDAAKMERRRGEPYEISSSGQTVVLGLK